VDFLHQFWRAVVPKEDSAVPRRPLGRCFASCEGLHQAFSVARAFGSLGENALDLIRRVVSDPWPIRLSGPK
jgi:hypothetical protein